MSKKFILVGKWYYISSSDPWKGRAMFLGNAPIQYPQGTLRFLCDDGEIGYFEPAEVTKPAPHPSAQKLQDLLVAVGKNLV